MAVRTAPAGEPLTAGELRPWALVVDPAKGSLYEVLWIEEKDGKVGLLDVAEDLPAGVVEPSRVVGLKWALRQSNLRLIRRAPRFAGDDSPSKTALSGALR